MTKFVSRTERDNYFHLVMDIAWFALALASTTRFLQFYAIRIGADAMQLGWLAALPSLVVIITTGLSKWWRNHYVDSVHAIWWPGIWFRLVYLLPVFAPVVPQGWRIVYLILAAMIPALGQGVASTIFVVMMRETVLPEHLSTLFSRRQLALNIGLILGATGFGFLLEHVAFPTNYQLMFVLAFVLSMISQWHLAQLRQLDNMMIEKHDTPRRALADILGDPYFQAVAFITLLCFGAFSSLVAVIPLYLKVTLGATEGYMALYSNVELLSGVAVLIVMQRLLHWLGSRKAIVLGMVGIASAAFVLALAPTLKMALGGAALTGMSWTIVSIAQLLFFTERTATDDYQATTLYHQMIFAAMFVGPLLGSTAASLAVPLNSVLIGGGLLRLLAAILVYFGLAIVTGKRIPPLRRVRAGG